MHDIGAIAQVRQIEGKTVAGFELLIGGGLGAVPRKARQLYEFIPREELFSVAQAIARIFTRHGERRNRNRARFKFVVDKLGIDPVREMIEEERSKIGRKKVGASIFSKYSSYSESPYKTPSSLDLEAQSDEFKNGSNTMWKPNSRKDIPSRIYFVLWAMSPAINYADWWRFPSSILKTRSA